MRAVLLGPNGQLGTDLRNVNSKRNLLEIVPIARSKVDLSNVRAAIAILRSIDFDLLINCSGFHRTDDAESNEPIAATINTRLVGDLARLCSGKRARFVHISTDYVFGGGEGRSPITETEPKAPLNVYGRTKSQGEDLAFELHDDVLVLRTASLFGVAGASGKGGNFVETIIRLGKEKGKLRVVNDQFMSPTATEDVARAILVLIERKAPSGIYHVVNSGSTSWHGFASRIIARVGVTADVEAISSAEYPLPAKRPPYSVLENQKTAEIVGKLAAWEEALDHYLAQKGYLA